MEEVFGIIFLSVVVPLWLILHYVTKAKAAKGLTKEDETMLRELWDTANRMEDRVRSLERILDADAGGWRGGQR